MTREQARHAAALDATLGLRVVAVALRAAALRHGDRYVGDAAGLHRLHTGDDPHWPRTATEMERRTLPALAARPGLAGIAVERLRNGHGWEIRVEAAHPEVRAMRAAA